MYCFRLNFIFYCDINSGNVMVWCKGDEWCGKFCDFGLVEFVGNNMFENLGNLFYFVFEVGGFC